MMVSVLLFASYAEAFGTSSLTLDVVDGASVRDVMRQLQSASNAASLPPSPLVAVNRSYAALDDRVDAGDEIAFIPPVAGG